MDDGDVPRSSELADDACDSARAEESTTQDEAETWAGWGEAGEEEDFLVGSRSGLETLRDYIQKAIDNGEVLIDAPGIGFTGIRRKDSRREVLEEDGRDKLLLFGCLAVGASIIGLAIYGLWSLLR